MSPIDKTDKPHQFPHFKKITDYSEMEDRNVVILSQYGSMKRSILEMAR